MKGIQSLSHESTTSNTLTNLPSGAASNIHLTVSEYKSAMQQLYGTYSPQFLEQYPATTNAEASKSYNAHYRDTSRISSWLFSNKWSKTATSKIYTYYWDHAPPNSNQGAGHMSEIVYCLNNLHTQVGKSWTVEDYAIQDKMSAYWANFAKTGDPNVGGSYNGTGVLEAWSPSSETKPVTFHVGDGWGDVPIGKPGQVQLISDFFSTQKPF
jgi:carboxylesterase 2